MVSIMDFSIKCDQIHIFLWIWSYLLKKSLSENIFMWWSIMIMYGANVNLEDNLSTIIILFFKTEMVQYMTSPNDMQQMKNQNVFAI